MFKSNLSHVSLNVEKSGISSGKEVWSARVSLKYRALAFKDAQDYVYFWIEEHNIFSLLVK